MNDYGIDDLRSGLSASFQREVTEGMLDAFRKLSGDDNPLHCDDAYARACGYPGRVAYGMLTASLYSTLAGVHLPGRRCLLDSVDAKFRSPVFPGDVLTVEGEIALVREDLGVVKIRASIRNQKGDKVSTASIVAHVREDDGE